MEKAEILLGGTWNNYEKIYEEDECYKELDTDARIWKVSNDESDRNDNELVDDWTKSLDTQLLFVSECPYKVRLKLIIYSSFL